MAGSEERGQLMIQQIGYVTLLVREHDEAIGLYTQSLGFELVEDKPLEQDKRWVRVAPRGKEEPQYYWRELLLPNSKAASATRRVAGSLFFYTPTISGLASHFSNALLQ